MSDGNEEASQNLPQKVLLATAGCLACASAYTTANGIELMLAGSGGALSSVVSWAIALGLSGLMFYLSALTIGATVVQLRRVVVAYLVVASVSMFFNFNLMYGAQLRQQGSGVEVRELRSELSRAHAAGLKSLGERLDLPALEQEVKRLEGELISEEEHATNPGKGPKYQAIREELERRQADLQVATERYSKIQESVQKHYEQGVAYVDSALGHLGTDGGAEDIRKAENAYSDMVAVIQANDSQFQAKASFATQSLLTDKPGGTVASVWRFVFVSDSPERKSDGTGGAILVSLGVSALLDIPAFIFLVFLSSSGTPTRVGKRRAIDGVRRRAENPFGEVRVLGGSSLEPRRRNRLPPFDEDIWGGD